ncbi:MAG TPA: OmpA family protein [Polyangia bacterium]|nr:OmpA family protein [Polyangia bacterium]
MNRLMISLLAIGTFTAACAHEESAKTASAPKPEASPPKQVARSAPPPAEPVAAAPRRDGGEAIYFDFDSSLVRDDARPVLQKVGQELKSNSESLKVEGNCDEVGTVEYNLALGEARARSAKEYLVHLGVPSGRIAIASYGSQRPKYTGHDEDAHAKNRRDDLLIR